MIQKPRCTKVNGVITVYLALILLLILSLVLTVIEGARVSTAKVYAERSLTTAMDSVWAEYYEPLWKEYHIFGYSAGAGSNSDKTGRIEDKLTEYMTYTLSPNTGLDTDYNKGGLELYDLGISSLSVTEQTGLMDLKGELLMKEAVEYMKYHELADGLSLLLEKLSLLETPKKVSVVYDKKLQAEVELAKADRNILRLMELLDGIRTTKNGIKLDGEGRLQVTEYFAKMLCFAPVSMETVGINHKEVFEVLRHRYVNPADTFAQVNIELDQLESVREQLYKLQEEIRAAYSSLEAARAQLQNRKRSGKNDGTKQSLSTGNNEIEGLQERINELKAREQELLEQKNYLTALAEDRLKRMNQILKELIPITEQAVKETEKVIINATSSSYLIEDFEESIMEEEEGLGEELIESLKEKLVEMKRYSVTYEEDGSFHQMQDSLESNLWILKDGQRAINQALDHLVGEDYPAALASSIASLKELQNYQIADLTIDYSTLVIDIKKQKNPVDEIGQLIQSGIAGLIIDPESISKKELTAEQLPSVEASLTKATMDFASMITSFFQASMIGGEENEMGNLLYSFRDSTELSEGIGKGINLITEHLLFQEYLKEHFESYPIGEAKLSAKKPKALDYELEYLLVGKSTDQQNLTSVITRIAFLRMMLDFVTLLGDKTRCEEAKLAAIAIVGFSGLPMLINLTQAVLLMVWSFAEALVDTCALLLGKEVPVLKQKLVLQFPEIFLLNRSFISTKAETYTTSKQLAFSYLDYLRVFLLIQSRRELIWHSMDLIQENLNLRYEEKFFLRDCLFGIETSADYTIDTRFIAVPLLRNYIKHNLIGYQFNCKAAYSY